MEAQTLDWTENGVAQSAAWLSARGRPAPRQVVVADDTFTADAAFRLTSQGTAILWRGDYHNARQLLQALGRRIDKREAKKAAAPADGTGAIFHAYRQTQAQRANILSLLLLPLEGQRVPLARAPDVSLPLRDVFGELDGEAVLPLRDLLALISAYEWRKNGVEVPALEGLASRRIHPHFGVFPPTRQEYIELLATAPLPAAIVSNSIAFDIGTGTGVLAAVLASKGVGRIIATDSETRAIACARENISRLGIADRVEVLETEFFPAGRAVLVVCNPPWLPAKAGSSLEASVYDPDSRMLQGFLAGLREHLLPGGEGWLILSDIAERLGLRTREQLLAMIFDAGLQVLGRLDIAPSHGRAKDPDDPLHAARAGEITSIWRLAAA